MSAALSPCPLFRGVANDGSALVGGKLSTFIAGTSTPQATYVDSTQTTPNTNPVILNARGEAPVWLDPTKTYRYLLQDAVGNQIWSVDNIANPQAVVFYPQTPAEANAGVTPASFNYPPGDVRRYGGVLDGSTDCVAAMVQACSVGQPVTIPGNMALASASLAALTNKAITLVSGTTIQSYSAYTTTVTGTTPCNVFWCINASNVRFLPGFVCVGNGSSSATSSTGFFWYLQGTAAQATDFGDCGYDGITLKNFAGLYWIYVDNLNATSAAYVRFRGGNGTFISQPGNCQTAGLTTITTTASVFGFSGSDTNLSIYTLKDVELFNNVAFGNYIKNFVYFWAGCLRCKAYSNILIGFGTDPSISDDTGCYALSTYNHGHIPGLPQPQEIEFYDNTIDSVRDAGIYCASANVLTIQNNRFQGQTSTATTLLPKGAICFAGSNDVTCVGNKMVNCAIGIYATQDPTSLRFDIRNTSISQVPANGTGMWISGTTGGPATNINVDGIDILSSNTTSRGIHISMTSAVGINNLSIQNFSITGGGTAFDLFAPDASVPAMGNVRIGQGRIRRATNNNLQWLNCTNPNSRSTFENIDFMDMQPGAVGFYFVNCVNITIRNLTFYDMTSGATFCWYGSGAQGRVMGVQYVNVGGANRFSGAGTELGVNAPGWTGATNDFVQDLNPILLTQTITGSGGTDSYTYTRSGWVWDRFNSLWRESRGLIV
jgi:hypothetical protein